MFCFKCMQHVLQSKLEQVRKPAHNCHPNQLHTPVHCHQYSESSIKPSRVRTSSSKLMNQLTSQHVQHITMLEDCEVITKWLSPVATMWYGSYLVTLKGVLLRP